MSDLNTVFERFIICRGQKFANTTDKAISYTDKYINVFGLSQEHSDILEPGQTFEKCNAGTAIFYLNK